ncbi:MAG: PaaI family thioesterase [Pseudomonadota bacterium]
MTQLSLPPFADMFGITLGPCTQDEIIGYLTVGAAHANRNGVMHGGAIMAFADVLGGTAASYNLGDGQDTTTIESKTNFLRPVALGETVTGRSAPLHRGGKTHVWQTTILRADGKPAAITTQTQLVFTWDGPSSQNPSA